MIHRRNVLLIIGYVLGLVSGTCVFVYTRHVSAAQLLKPVRPFTAQYTENYYAAKGRAKRTVVTLYARASDRSTSWKISETVPTRRAPRTYISDTRVGQNIYLEPKTKSVTRFQSSRERVLSDLTNLSSESCPADMDKLAKAGVYFGYQSVHSVTQVDPTWVEEKWIIPELECFAVKQIDYLMVNGVVGAHNETVVTTLTEGEPAPDFMDVPPAYVERSPAQVDDALSKQSPGELFWGPDIVKRIEPKYWHRAVPIAK